MRGRTRCDGDPPPECIAAGEWRCWALDEPLLTPFWPGELVGREKLPEPGETVEQSPASSPASSTCTWNFDGPCGERVGLDATRLVPPMAGLWAWVAHLCEFDGTFSRAGHDGAASSCCSGRCCCLCCTCCCCTCCCCTCCCCWKRARCITGELLISIWSRIGMSIPNPTPTPTVELTGEAPPPPPVEPIPPGLVPWTVR